MFRSEHDAQSSRDCDFRNTRYPRIDDTGSATRKTRAWTSGHGPWMCLSWSVCTSVPKVVERPSRVQLPGRTARSQIASLWQQEHISDDDEQNCDDHSCLGCWETPRRARSASSSRLDDMHRTKARRHLLRPASIGPSYASRLPLGSVLGVRHRVPSAKDRVLCLGCLDTPAVFLYPFRDRGLHVVGCCT